MMFKGVYTALITPFRNGSIDYADLEKIIENQISGGIDGVVPMGTTGESPTVSFDEHRELISRVVKIVKGRIKVIAGTGANSTDEAIYLTKEAETAGVDGVMLVNPYYNKPPQRGMIAHFEKVAKSVKLPVVIYNIPGRTGINFFPESLKELNERAPNVIAVKEASGDINQMMRVIEICGDSVSLLSGDDNLFLPVLGIGGNGLISVLSNIIPADVKKVYTLYMEGKIEEARKFFYTQLPLSRVVFIETNPIPIKAVMEMAGFCTSEIRLPLVPLQNEGRQKLRKAFEDYGMKLK
jgi:4-hydroxy-tetrahydrodipicolinate synthase